MKYAAVIVSGLLSFSISFLSAQTANTGLDELAEWMTGSFSSAEQAKSDTNFYDVRLNMVRIWKDRHDAVWFYIEQAYGDRLDKPYRQRVYRLTRTDDSTFESKVYEIATPLRFAGEWKREAPLASLTPDSLSARPGCSMIIRKSAADAYTGRTPGKDCLSSRKGAVYAVSEMTLKINLMITLERGFDASGKQVWGSEHGGYFFRKLIAVPIDH